MLVYSRIDLSLDQLDLPYSCALSSTDACSYPLDVSQPLILPIILLFNVLEFA